MNDLQRKDSSMKEQWNESTATAKGLYDPSFEHDNCGIGAVVNIKGIKTHQTVENALKIVENLKHRAGKDADGKTGDGVGILLQISHKFFKKAVEPLGIKLGEERDYGVGMFFFPQDELKTNQAKKMFEVIVEKEGMEFLGWRQVPIHPDKLSDKARGCMPCIMQAFIKRPEDVEKGLDFDRKLYVARRVFEQSNDDSYVASLSSRTIVYKGMFLVEQLRQFFSVTVPNIVPAFTTNVTLLLAWGLRTFDMPMAVARNAREGQFTAVYVYDSIFSNNKAGLGQAAAVILTIILVVLTQIVTRSLRRLEVEQ